MLSAVAFGLLAPAFMTLDRYRRPRMVVQNPGTPIRDAARAMESNRIGTVVVRDRGQIVDQFQMPEPLKHRIDPFRAQVVLT